MEKLNLLAIKTIILLLLTVSSYAGENLCDINNDNKTGLEEAIYALQVALVSNVDLNIFAAWPKLPAKTCGHT